MTTINAYSVSLGLAAGGFVDGAKLARGEATSLNRTLASLADPVEKVNKQLLLLEKAVDEGAIRESVYREGVARLTAKITDNTAALQANAEVLKRDNQLIAEGERLTKSLMTAEERHIQDLRKVNELYQAGTIGATTRARAIADLSVKLAQASGEQTKLAVAATQADAAVASPGVLSRLGMLAGAYLGVHAAVRTMTSSVKAAADVESATAAFSVLTGDGERGKALLSQIRDLTSKAPISFSAATQSARTLLSFNVAAESVLPTLKRLGEITGGDTERFKMLSLAFAQSSAAGRLMGQDLLQMINAGFNPLQEISKRTGRSLVDLKKDMENGAISFAMVEDAFQSATDKGGMFFGMLEKRSETTGGAMQRASAKVEMLKVSLGEALSPVVREFSNELADSTKSLDSFVGSINSVSGAVASMAHTLKEASDVGIVSLAIKATGLAQILKGLSVPADFLRAFGALDGAKELGLKPESMTVEAFRKAQAENKKANEAADDIQRQALTRLRETFGPGILSKETNEKLNALNRLAWLKQLDAKNELANKDSITTKTVESKKAEEERQKELDKINKKYETQRDSLRVQIEKLDEGKAAAAGLKSELVGMTDPQQRHITMLARQLEYLEKQAKTVKEQATLREKMEREAERIKDKFATPMEKFVNSLADIERLRRLEVLTDFEAKRAKQEAVKDSMKDIKIEQPKSMELGSADAFKYISELQGKRQSDAVKLAAEQLALDKAMLEAQKITNAKLDKLADVSPRRTR